MILLAFQFIRDLDRIQTCNLLSRNQMRYSVAPRGRFYGQQIYFFFSEMKKLLNTYLRVNKLFKFFKYWSRFFDIFFINK